MAWHGTLAVGFWWRLFGLCPRLDHCLLVFVDADVRRHRFAADLAILHVLLLPNGLVHGHFELFAAIGAVDELTVH